MVFTGEVNLTTWRSELNLKLPFDISLSMEVYIKVNRPTKITAEIKLFHRQHFHSK